jgi:hypothetical protein
MIFMISMPIDEGEKFDYLIFGFESASVAGNRGMAQDEVPRPAEDCCFSDALSSSKYTG